jgi:competence protein ComEC
MIQSQKNMEIASRKLLPTLLLIALGLACLFLWQQPDDNLRVVFCDVGQGDAVLLTRGDNQILVDGGEDEAVLTCLGKHMPFWDRCLEMVVLTHPEKDHFGGLASVIERYQVNYFVKSPLVKENKLFNWLSDLVSNGKITLISPWQGDKISFNGVNFLFLWPQKEWFFKKLSADKVSGADLYQSKEILVDQVLAPEASWNDFSLVARVSFGNFDLLLTGDADSRIQPEILATASFPPVEVLKVAHHGSKYAFTDEFLERAQPLLAVISVGKNPWGHPHQILREQLEKEGLLIKRTDQDGDVVVASNGQRWWIEE